MRKKDKLFTLRFHGFHLGKTTYLQSDRKDTPGVYRGAQIKDLRRRT